MRLYDFVRGAVTMYIVRRPVLYVEDTGDGLSGEFCERNDKAGRRAFGKTAPGNDRKVFRNAYGLGAVKGRTRVGLRSELYGGGEGEEMIETRHRRDETL